MRGPLGIALAGLAMLVGVSSAYAAGGRVVFSGAVVEPTCPAAGLDEVGAYSRAGAAPQRMSCGNTATDPGRPYSRVVVDLATANRNHDRLLDYFAGYATTGGEAAAKVVIHTYD